MSDSDIHALYASIRRLIDDQSRPIKPYAPPYQTRAI
jgi:hypothetical protein